MTVDPRLHNRDGLIEDALAAARARYVESHPQSRAAFERACRVMPGGNTRSVLYHGPFPFRAVRGEGPWLWDAEGHRLLDLLGEYTAGLFGHSNPVIRAAVERALARGWNYGAHNPYEIALAELLCARFASLERVRFTNSGTEANLMAVSAARCFTGRDKVMAIDGAYHGGLLTFAHGPSPVNAPYPVVLARYNDAEGLAALMAEHGAELACLLVEPMMGAGGCIPAEPAFLEAALALTRRAGALLIFDEVMTSRMAAGGCQARLGIAPDLTTLGKYLGGGMSFGAFGGRQDVMALFDPTAPEALPHAGTFNNNVVTLAAGAAALGEVFTPEAAEALFRRGEALRARLNARFAARDAPYLATGLGSIMTLHPRRADPAHPIARPEDLADTDPRLRELLFLELLARGHYTAPRGFIALSLELTETHLAAFESAVDEVLDTHAEALGCHG
jgi:glutamate-1-semialdehyde 2,1-aminomutase